MAEQEHEHEDGYAGPATLSVNGRDVPVRVLLDARHEPHDGRMHWFGRLSIDAPHGEDAELVGALTATASRVELSTPGGRAEADVGDLDPWGRYRVTGVGTPPYRLDVLDPEDPD